MIGDYLKRKYQNLVSCLQDIWLTYTLNTALYMCESWECAIFNSVLVTILAMVLYTGYVFLPGHVIMFTRIFQKYVLGEVNDGVADDVATAEAVQAGS